ncbi:MAG: pentapeptide repeat-containing protein [Pirellulaceae bacterium]
MNKPICFLILLLSGVALSAPAGADTETPKIVRGPFAGDLKIGPGMVVAGHQLWGSEIVGQDLRGAKFDDCVMANVVIRQCKLQDATFRRAIMTGLLVDDCEWENNDYSDAVINGIRYPSASSQAMAMGMTAHQLKTTWSYQNRDLDDCPVPSNSDGSSYDFSGFSLVNTHLLRISSCKFDRAGIAESTFQNCDLTQCSFEGATVRKTRFEHGAVDLDVLADEKFVELQGCELAAATFVGSIDFSGTDLIGGALSCDSKCEVNFENAKINGFSVDATLNGSNIASTQSFKDGNLSDLRVSKSDFSNTDFSGQVLVRAMFWKCDFTNCKFDDAVLTNASFNECTGLTRKQIESTWNFKHQHLPDIELPDGLLPQN